MDYRYNLIFADERQRKIKIICTQNKPIINAIPRTIR